MADDTKQNIEEIMGQVQSVNADDPDMLEKLNEIAMKVAEAQGKTGSAGAAASAPKAQVDPMDELGCEGCQ